MSHEYLDVELAKRLRSQGNTMKFIADYMGISRRVLYGLRKRGEIELDEKRVYIGRENYSSPMRSAAQRLGFCSIQEMMRHYRLTEKKTYAEISKLTWLTIQSVRYWMPDEIRQQYIQSKEGAERKREGWKKALKKIRLTIFNGEHEWQRHNKTSCREVSINNFSRAKAHLTKREPDLKLRAEKI
jgi:hypothetical protein